MSERRWRPASDSLTLALYTLEHGSGAAPLPPGEPSSVVVEGRAGLLSARAEMRLHLRLPAAALADCDAALALCCPEHRTRTRTLTLALTLTLTLALTLTRCSGSAHHQES